MNIEQAVLNVKLGIESDYEHIVHYYEHKIYTTVYRLVREHDLANDLVQEIFIKAFYNIHQYTATVSFNAWLYRIVVNHCIDSLRKNKKQQSLYEVELGHKLTPEYLILEKEKLENLDEMLEKLNQTEYFVLVLRYINELSYEEISEVLNITHAEVRNKLHRSKRKLREAATYKGGYFDEMRL